MDALTPLREAIDTAAPADCPSLLGVLEELKGRVLLKLMQGPIAAAPPAPTAQNGHYLTVEEVCQRFGVTAKWLYRHKKKLPHSQPSRKVLLFPEEALCRWFERHHAA